jgi:hypothetical protein
MPIISSIKTALSSLSKRLLTRRTSRATRKKSGTTSRKLLSSISRCIFPSIRDIRIAPEPSDIEQLPSIKEATSIDDVQSNEEAPSIDDVPSNEEAPSKEEVPSNEEAIYTYIIQAHGTMFSQIGRFKSNPEKKEKIYFAIDIPQNVELYTFTDIGTVHESMCNKKYINASCDYKPEREIGSSMNLIDTVTSKYVFDPRREKNKFPELFLASDDITLDLPNLNRKIFYSGIIHCIPRHLRKSNKAKEIIYNIDALNHKNCDCKLIQVRTQRHVQRQIQQIRNYDCNKYYSTDYNENLKAYNYDANEPTTTINKCGPILLSEALKLIKKDCIRRYNNPSSTIKIYINCCLVITNLNLMENNNKASYDECMEEKATLEKQLKTTPLFDDKFTTAIEKLNLRNIICDYYLNLVNHNTSKKIDRENIVKNLNEFRGIDLVESGFKTYTLIYRNAVNADKTFKIKTNKTDFELPLVDQVETEKIGTTISLNNESIKHYLYYALRKWTHEQCENEVINMKNNLLLNLIPEIINIDLTLIVPSLLTGRYSNEDIDEKITEEIYKQLSKVIEHHEKTLVLAKGINTKTLRKKSKKSKNAKKQKNKEVKKFTK